MKKGFLILVLFISISGYSQLTGGVKAGALLANLKFENDLTNSKMKPSFYVGGFIEFKILKFAPEIEVTYNQFGSKGETSIRENFDDPISTIDSEYKINSLMISPSLKFYATKKFALKFGGYYNSILSADFVSEGMPSNGGVETTYDLSNSWNKSEFGLTFGLSFDITKNIFVESSYIYGLSDLSGTQNNEVNNRSFRIGGGYKF